MIAIKGANIIEVKDAKHRATLERNGYSIYEVTRSKYGQIKRGKLLFAPCLEV